ncbi:cytochrome c class I [Niastella yeongjuensis]|uniref:Cytochrome c class I n=1 Tax=Niastella yeongjuensis TaxID=354355 RepID=A0A1V9EW45_9BACT|nr:c-type cytochrome [Niastella yeongjuensis]OQP50378.1 cytochrome c class I [Niastella yeongjuensis]SEN37047.1 cytochrome c [Niastella yeongjuensis]
MKKLVVFAALCTAMVACGSGDTNKGKEDKPAESASTPAPAATGSNDKGLDMIAALDCTTCHKINEKNIGPAYTDVAKKYEATDANIETLANKVIKGGSGNWGTVPMTPHPAVSVDSAKEMVRYILSLKNQ